METNQRDLAKTIEDQLLKKHGMVLSTKEIASILGFPSNSAFRQAVQRGSLKIPLFRMDGRRCRFALTKEIAQYLANRRAQQA